MDDIDAGSSSSPPYEQTDSEFRKWSLVAVAEFSATFMLIFVTMGGELVTPVESFDFSR